MRTQIKIFRIYIGTIILQAIGQSLCSSDRISYAFLEDSSDSDTSSKSVYEDVSSNGLRFRDFEPRSINTNTTMYTSHAVEDRTVSNNHRKARGFQFHADKNDLVVDIEFIVPFIRIPVGRSMAATTSTFRNLVNLNTGTLLWSGAFIAVGAIVAIILKLLTTPILFATGTIDNKRNARAADRILDVFNLVTSGQMNNTSVNTNDTKVNDFINLIETKLHENDIDMTSCIQKSICNYVGKAGAIVRSGNATSMEKIIDGFASLEWLRTYLSGTAVQHAINNGRIGNNCNHIYRNCKWQQSENRILKLIMNYLKYFIA